MSGLPYYRWYPADAETDEFYSSLTDEELGFFHRCLNKSWINNGLPTDLEKLAAMMGYGRSRKTFARIWRKVVSGFVLKDGKIKNLRQEQERDYAISKSLKSIESVKARYERSTDEVRTNYHARYDSVSDSVLAFKEKSSLPKNEESRWPQGWDFEVWFSHRLAKHPLPGRPQISKGYALDRVWKDFRPDEFDASHDAWCVYWESRDGGIPNLATFIFEDWWKRKPPEVKKPPQRKSIFDIVEEMNAEDRVAK